MRFLVLEDYFPLRQEIIALIEDMGHEAHGAMNATEATVILKSSQFDAMIADIFVTKDEKLTPDGGLLMITRVRRSPNNLMINSDAPILVITAGVEIPGGASPIQLVLNMGADKALRKPLDQVELQDWINSVAPKVGDVSTQGATQGSGPISDDPTS